MPPLAPRAALPRPAGPWETAGSAFWAARATSPTRPALAVVGGVAVVALSLVDERPGLGLAVVLVGAGVAAAPAVLRRRDVGDAVTLALAMALASSVAVRDAGWVQAVALLAALAAGAVAVTGARTAASVLLAPLATGVGVARTLPFVRVVAARLAGRRKGELLVGLRSVAVTVVLLVVFGALFVSADSVFAAYLPRPELGSLPARLAVALLMGLGALALAHVAAAPPAWPAPRAAGRRAGLGEWLLPIAALDLLVLAFVTVQAMAAWAPAVTASAGVPYAHHAREGFGQLVVATALTLVVVAVAARRAPRLTSPQRVVTASALGVLCVGTLGVVATAVSRMLAYVDAYGLTRLRLLVLVAELVLGVVLALVLAAGVRWRGGWLPRVVVPVVAAAVLGLVASNPDAVIVRYDAAADAPVDVGYLRGLSADAVPALAELDEPLRSCVLGVAPGAVGSHRATRAEALGTDGAAGWNLGRQRARAVLADADLLAVDPWLGRCVEDL